MKGPEAHVPFIIATGVESLLHRRYLGMARPRINIRPFVALLSFAFLPGCDTTAGDVFQNPSRAPVSFGEEGSAFTYVVMGDSTAAGQGAPYPQGIAVGTAESLAKTRRVTMTNLAVSGARIKDVLDDQLHAAARLRPDLVLLSVGANDVTHLSSVAAMRSRLLHVVRGLKIANPAAIIVLTGSPDMGAPPRIPALLRGLASRRTEAVNEMFRRVAAEEHLTFAPIADVTGPFFRKDRSLFDTDRFHPNARGYATWIPVIDQAFVDALHASASRAMP
jgi:lysophospholipase L1-like esterase